METPDDSTSIPSQERPFVVKVLDSGAVWIEGRDMGLHGLMGVLKRGVGRESPTLRLEVQDNVSAQLMVKVIDACSLAGLKKVVVMRVD